MPHKKRYRSQKVRHREYERARRSRHKEKIKWQEIKRDYGITKQQFDAMLTRQHNCCAICSTLFVKTPHIDHCHKTKRVRGLLCAPCNVGLGCFADDPIRMTKAIEYLQ